MKALLPKSIERRLPREESSPRKTLLDFFDEVYASPAEFLVYADGYRTWTYTYEQVRGAAYTFGARLRREGIGKGEKLILWGENRPEWIVALWGALSEGVIVVPVDYRSSADLVLRLQGVVEARAVLVGEEVELESPGDLQVWRLADLDWTPGEPPRDRVCRLTDAIPQKSSSRPGPRRSPRAW